ncbi:terpenoid synthase [Schizopora paradoxa]|uniref:Terpene synthase n=1 Tax=Schizopora paradoxa TaxID=27342 RepID=A0A0H2RU95_9AGAM|nr:terpenoid synthase [Schizopora paradoxa]
MHLSNKLVLPDLLAACPFKWSIHPDFERARDESAAWISGFKVLPEHKRVLIESELLIALVIPFAGYEELRTYCDFSNLLFVVDEYSDELNGAETQKFGEVFVKALSGEPTQGSVFSKIGEEFRSRLIQKAKPKCMERFLARFAGYINAVSKESALRCDNEVLDIESFIHVRRENSAVRVCFSLLEYIHGIELPDEVFEHPVFMRLYWQGVDAVWLANDLYSYSMERAKGLEGSNMLTIAMKEKGLSMQGAADYVGDEIMLRMNQFVADQKELPSFGEAVDKDVQKYIFSMSQWQVGSMVWSFQSSRYFGAEKDEVKKTLVVNVKNYGDDDDDDADEGVFE